MLPAQLQNGARILSFLQRKPTWPALCEAFGLPSKDFKGNSFAYTLYKHLGELRKLGLIEFVGDVDAQQKITGKIKVSKKWTEVQNALGQPPLADLAEISTSAGGMAVNPLFGRPDRLTPTDVFVVMPFEIKYLYENHIRKLAKKLGVSIRRGDDIFTVKSVMNKVWADINSARIIIADCTGRNANVFYELGIAHVIGKPVVLITQKKDDIPTDIKYIEYIEYVYTPEGIKVFKSKLAEVLKKELKPAPKAAAPKPKKSAPPTQEATPKKAAKSLPAA